MFASRTNWNLQPNALSRAIERLTLSGREFLDLTAANPTECGFVYESERIRTALSTSKALVYEPAPFGILSAREAVSGYYAEKGIEAPPDHIMLTASTSEAYSYIFRLLCNPGDEVLVPRPSYPLFDLLADVQDVALKSYDLFYDHGWHLDPHSLELQITERTRAVMVVSPNNPTGSYLVGKEADDLEQLCAKRGIAIVADEVFYDFPASIGGTRKSWASRRHALTFTLSGLSKVAGLPQIKLAWCVVNGPEDLRSEALKRLEIIADTYLSVNAPVQHALSELLAAAEPLRQQIGARCARNLEILDGRLKDSKSCMRLRVDAGWYAVVRIPRIFTDEEFAVALLERHGVLVHPGHFYNFREEGYIVISLMPESRVFETGVRRALELANETMS